MKIGSASWIKRGTYLDNSEALEKRVDFVELLIYTWDRDLEKILENELPRLRNLSLFYTVHLPLDNMENCQKAYYFFKEKGFPVKSFTLHPLKGWERFIREKRDVILENLIDVCVPFERMCLDIGHLTLSKKEDFLLHSSDLKIIKEFHIHGVVRHKDHCVLNVPMMNYVAGLKKRYPVVESALARTGTLMNFEIFDLKKLLISLRRLKANEISGSQTRQPL